MVEAQVDIGSQKVTMIKLKPDCEGITEKEKAKFTLETNIQALSERIEQTVAKIGALNVNIHAMIKVSKKSALILLSQKKKLESFLEKIQQQKFILED